MTSIISIRGAREHNLKNVNVDIPRDKLVVITGLSGSGKSSLAFDTLYAEGQRRYVESLSAYARQFLQLMQKPDVDSIEGLSPAISIEQKTTSKNPRSTVGTVTELYDYLRLLFARIGTPYSPATGLPIEAQTVSQMVDRILALPEKTRLLVLAPIVRGRKGEYKKEILELRKKGFQRIRIDGTVYEIDETPDLNKKVKHDIDVVIDRIVVNPEIGTRLADSLETALDLSDGLVYIENADTHESFTLSSKFACPVSGFTIDEIEPRLFSFNSPHGACPTCDGLGIQINFDQRLVVPDPSLSIRDGAIAPWSTADNTSKRAAHVYEWYMQTLSSVVHHFGGDIDAPFEKLQPPLQNALLHGSGQEDISMIFDDGVRRFRTSKPFEGVIPNLERRWKETESDWMREELSKYQTTAPCKVCKGYRLKPEALCVKINDKSIGQVTELSIQESADWFMQLQLTPKQQDIAYRILKEINSRLQFLVNVGLDYLTLSRSSGTLSGGESQRIRLASQIGSGLTGVLYVLDEPSIGLHQRDNDKLLETLRHLRDIGNTVVVVEHDEDAIRLADHVIDMGPRAGVHGGQIIAQGTPQEIMDNPDSITGAYLTHQKKIPLPTTRRSGHKEKTLSLRGATVNNLKNVKVDIPLGTFTCITGVSGGGKSSLTIETLYKALAHKLNGSRGTGGDYQELKGVEHLDKVIDIDQSPIGRTPRSNPATYIGCFTPIREWFSGLPESKARGYSPGRFSFNVKGGRCEACQGDGVIKIEMHFLPDVYVQCDQCHGKRYNRETLEVTFKGKSIADVLDMTVEEATTFFEAHAAVRNKLETLQQVGLGYIHVGQQATTLSGGEAQRVKLAKELSKRATGKTIYILDEPTTGLHFDDIAKLLEVLHALVDQGNTVVVIEHNLEVIKTADYIIDMGPEGGHKGGEVVAEGTPEEIVKVKASYTGKYLKEYLAV
ncbi:excinuclease ABC subunit UvrA [Candidatus Odyssella acanthamoebae]|uniref:UvrABC system protein A n=1 Tax=Candidatus Odyssella acanthamoebae TaxID=91604 RepID=A0A077AQY6_9PROT|nr:excinuclease ABC subunit UvrA [Candidatus Paracaedibacter acanthamoebae]AIK95592.1 excinuclease ABC subunit A [Candidatus Paracaedibacter acanthamoebae]